MLLKLPNGSILSVAAIIGVGAVRPFKRTAHDPEKGVVRRAGWKFLYSLGERDFTIEGTAEGEVKAAREYMVKVLEEYHAGTPTRGIDPAPVREMPPVEAFRTDTLQQA